MKDEKFRTNELEEVLSTEEAENLEGGVSADAELEMLGVQGVNRCCNGSSNQQQQQQQQQR